MNHQTPLRFSAARVTSSAIALGSIMLLASAPMTGCELEDTGDTSPRTTPQDDTYDEDTQRQGTQRGRQPGGDTMTPRSNLDE